MCQKTASPRRPFHSRQSYQNSCCHLGPVESQHYISNIEWLQAPKHMQQPTYGSMQPPDSPPYLHLLLLLGSKVGNTLFCCNCTCPLRTCWSHCIHRHLVDCEKQYQLSVTVSGRYHTAFVTWHLPVISDTAREASLQFYLLAAWTNLER